MTTILTSEITQIEAGTSKSDTEEFLAMTGDDRRIWEQMMRKYGIKNFGPAVRAKVERERRA